MAKKMVKTKSTSSALYQSGIARGVINDEGAARTENYAGWESNREKETRESNSSPREQPQNCRPEREIFNGVIEFEHRNGDLSR